MLFQLAGVRGAVICPAGLDAADAVAQEPFGSGPFTLEDVVRGDSYTFRVRDDYA